MGDWTHLRFCYCCDRIFRECEANGPTFHFFSLIGAQLWGGTTGLEPSRERGLGIGFWKGLPSASPANQRGPTPVGRISSRLAPSKLPGAVGPSCVFDYSTNPSHF